MKGKLTLYGLPSIILIFAALDYTGYRFNLYTLYEAIQILVTAVLVTVTAIYAYITDQIRIESVKPSLSLWPEHYTLGGEFGSLYLHNNGGVAKNIEIDVIADDPTQNYKSYIPALDKEHNVLLSMRGKSTKIIVNCKFQDSYNRNLTEHLGIDFAKLQRDERQLAYQHDPLLSDLDTITRELSNIERKLSEMKSAIQSIHHR